MDLSRPVDNDERLEIALEAAGLGTWELNLQDDTSPFRSLRHDELFGYETPQAIWGRAIAERHLLDEDKPTFNAAFERAIKTGLLHFEVRVRWPDGTVHWIAADGRTNYDCNGEAVRMIGVVREITAEKAALESSARANALLDAIFKEAPVGLGAWDDQFRFLRVNERLAEINGLPPEAHIGKRPDEILPDIADIEAVYDRWRQVVLTGQPWLDVEIKGATPAQPGIQRTWSENFYPIRAGGKVIGIGAVVEETTERKRHEARTRLLLEEVNHRTKNMLAVVQAVVQQSASTTEERAFLNRLSQRLSGLAACQDLLVDSGWDGVCLHALATSQIANVYGDPSNRVEFAGAPVRLNAAAAQTLGMALHELAANAAAHGALAASDGSIRLSWDIRHDPGGFILMIEWREKAGLQTAKPWNSGCGYSVMTQMVEYGLDASVTVDNSTQGLRWTCLAPVSSVLENAERTP